MRSPSRGGGYDALRLERQVEPLEARLRVVSGLDVEPRQVEWLWPGRIPAGRLTILTAFPGTGKTFVSCQLAACVTTGGNWPDGSGRARVGEVAFLNSEDALVDTLLPRLIAQGVDRSKVHFIEAVEDWDDEGHPIERAVRFDRDIESMRQFLESHREVRLLVVDPLSAYLGTDRRKKGEAGAVLGELCRLAEDFGVAVVGISPLSKEGRGTAVTRSLESSAVVSRAQAVWVHVQDPEDPDRVLWLPLKMKLARRPNGLAYRIVEGRVEWEADAVEVSAEVAMSRSAALPKGDRVSEAAAWLGRQLAGGEWVKSAEIEEKLEAARISFTTYKRARKVLEVESCKGFGRGGWCMRLPQESPGSPDGAGEAVEPVELVEPDELLEPVEPDEPVETVAHPATFNREVVGGRVTRVEDVEAEPP